MKRLLLFSFLCLIFSVGCAQENRRVLAVQALFQEEAMLDALREKAENYDTITSARSLGARPHMTMASFNLTEHVEAEITETLKTLDKKYPSHRFPVKLAVEAAGDEKWSYFFVLTAADEQLTKIHDSLYITVDQGYEKQREMDRPGKWWPHISLFAVHGTSPELPAELAAELEKVKHVTLDGFSLVSFGPIKYLEEIKTSGSED